MKLTIDVLGYMDGFYQVKITKPDGHTSRWEFTLRQLREEIATAKVYCSNKDYKFELKGLDSYGVL